MAKAAEHSKRSTGVAGTPGLLQGKALAGLLEQLRTKVEADTRRLMAKGRQLDIRMEGYVAAQSNDAIRVSVKALLAMREWRYVSFAEFVGTLGRVVDRLHAIVAEKAKKTSGSGSRKPSVCFVVDSLHKSSFWVVTMALLMRPLPGACLAVDGLDVGVGIGIGPSGEASLVRAFQGLPEDTTLVLMDDATYSGDQLSYFHDLVVGQWKSAHSSPASIVVGVPFMSRPSTALFRRRDTTVLVEETFPSLFDHRPPAQVLASDLFVEMRRPASSRSASSLSSGADADSEFGPLAAYAAPSARYSSLYFDVIRVAPTHTLFVFEHKVADSLSIPNRWLKMGPCVPPSATRAYRVRPERAKELLELLRRDLVDRQPWDFNPGAPGSPSQRLMQAASRRTCELLASSPRFRAEFFDRVSLLPPTPTQKGAKPKRAVAYFPLLAPEFCDASYRRYVRRRRASQGDITLSSDRDDLPPCRRPPYRRNSFRRRVNF